KIFYYAVELFPLHASEYSLLNYSTRLKDDSFQSYFMKMHDREWEKDITIHSLFFLHKTNQSLLNILTDQSFNLIFFDAFAPNTQPESWTLQVFKKMFHLLLNQGVLVTHCSNGDVRRSMVKAGFKVEKLPGPLGKREMLRALK